MMIDRKKMKFILDALWNVAERHPKLKNALVKEGVPKTLPRGEQYFYLPIDEKDLKKENPTLQ